MLNHFDVFDSHFHIINSDFPVVANNGYMPDEFTCDYYLARTKHYRLVGGAIVSGSFQGFDQTYLVDSLEKMGNLFVGVTQVPASVADQELIRLDKAGVRAVHFNLKRGGSEDVSQLVAMGKRVYDLLGWHVELYVDSKDLLHLYDALLALPLVSIDHLGLSSSGLDLLKQLASKGIKIKATGFSRVNFDVGKVLKELYAENPASLMFGTDLPSTRAPSSYKNEDLLLVIDTLGEVAAKQVLSENALAFYMR